LGIRAQKGHHGIHGFVYLCNFEGKHIFANRAFSGTKTALRRTRARPVIENTKALKTLIYQGFCDVMAENYATT
jgi:hypothetical protein